MGSGHHPGAVREPDRGRKVDVDPVLHPHGQLEEGPGDEGHATPTIAARMRTAM